MRKSIALGVILLGLVFTAAVYASDVVQGECVDYKSNIIKLRELDTHFTPESRYGRPTGIESEYDASHAEIGMQPERGDILRIAYKLDGNNRRALKVMNVSKQDLMKK